MMPSEMHQILSLQLLDLMQKAEDRIAARKRRARWERPLMAGALVLSFTPIFLQGQTWIGITAAVIMWAYVIGMIAVEAVGYRKFKTEQKQTMARLENYCRTYGIPWPLVPDQEEEEDT